MRRMINTVAALFITIAMIAAPEANAQSRRSSGGASTATRSSFFFYLFIHLNFNIFFHLCYFIN